MSDQPNDDRVTLRPPPGYAWQNGELTAADTQPTVRTLLLEDGVDSDLDLQVKILDSGIAGASPMLALSRPGEDHPNVSISQRLLLRVAAAVAPDGPVVTERDGRLSVAWPDPRPRVFGMSDDLFEGMVDQMNRLRADLAEAVEERDRLAAWSEELAHRVPETYEGGEGTQEACIDRWVRDLEQVAGPFAVTLRAVPAARAILQAVTTPLPADPLKQERLYDAAARLGGE